MSTVQRVCRTDSGLASELRSAVMRLRRRLVTERDPENPLSLGATAVLGQLSRRGELSVGELARAERVQPPSMTRTVNALHQEGYLTRRRHPSDGRQVLVSLSETGEETLRADRRRRDAWLARQMAHLSADERDTLRAAAPILDRLAQAD